MLRVAGEMASGVAHDFNNVLGAIMGRTQLLKLKLETGPLSSAERRSRGASSARVRRRAALPA